MWPTFAVSRHDITIDAIDVTINNIEVWGKQRNRGNQFRYGMY